MPDTSATIVRGVSQKASVKYENQQYIGREVYPILRLPTTKSKVATFNRGDVFRNEAKARARGTVTEAIDWKYSTSNVDTIQYAAKHLVTKEDLRDAGINPPNLNVPLSLEQEAMMRNADKLSLREEIAIAASVTGATWADASSGGQDADGKWAASSGNTFLTDVDTGINKLREGGIPLNHIRLAMDFETWQGVRKNSDIASRTQYTKDKYPNVNDMAAYLAIDKILIGGAIYSSANEAADGTDFTAVNIWGGSNDKGYAIVYYYPPSVGLRTMAAGYTCVSKMENGADRVTYKHYDKDAHTWKYEAQEEVGVKIIASAAAYAWKDTHTT